ncbi:MAG: transporter substrate-binding domain-containing protein, partial [Proteobacteria bacterium]|nr:transporter substrate-binding domain-containing protein [Pseudomonadota bacterium]
MKPKKRPESFFRILLFTVCLLFFQADFAGAHPALGEQAPFPDVLSHEERAWLKAHPTIRLAPDPQFSPIEFFDPKGNYSGLAADYARLLEQKLGIQFKIIRAPSWEDVILGVKRREVDILNAVVKTPQRELYLHFPHPYLTVPSVIIVRKKVRSGLTLDMLKDMTVVMVSGYGYVDLIQNKNPELNIQLVPDLKTALGKVSFGMADAFVGDLASASFQIELEGITNLKLAGETDPPNISGFAVRSDWPELSRILEKGMALITEKEKKAIYNKWIHLESDTWITRNKFKQMVVITASIIALVLLGFLLWNRMLRRMVRVKTKDLEKEIEGHKRTEAALKASEEKYRSIIENAVEGVFQSTPKGQFIIVNPAFARMLGYASSEELITRVQDISTQYYVNPQDRIHYQQRLQRDGYVEHFEFRARKKDGSQIWVSNSTRACLDPDGNIHRYEGTVQNITARKLAEEALQESQEQFSLFMDYLPALVFIKDETGRTLFVNRHMEEVLGAKDWIGKTPLDLFPQDLAVAMASDDQKTMAQGYRRIIEIVPDKQGALHVYQTHKFKINRAGKPPLLGGIALDISQLKLAEEEKLTAQKIAAEQGKQALVGQIAGKMAHDFNNILGIIMGNTELALLDCRDGQIQKTLELIFEQTVRGKNLTKNLVAFAKDQEPKQEFFRISEKIDLVLNLMRKDLAGIELVKEEHPGVPELLADPGMIEHALVNLIQNAIHALGRTQNPTIRIRTYSRDNLICFEIEDNGCGIPQENLDDIYEPSFTLKGRRDLTGAYDAGIKGTGYGMSNVKKYIEQHRGTILVRSQVGVGTHFTIRLPVIKKQLTREEKIQIRAGKPHFEKYILLVEDET